MQRWCDERQIPRGAVMSAAQCADLGRRWYAGRMEREWRPRTADQTRAVLAEAGLSGDFWRVDG